jgi:hypothetical protein
MSDILRSKIDPPAGGLAQELPSLLANPERYS